MYITNPRGRRNMPRQGTVQGGVPRNDRSAGAPIDPKPVNYTPNVPPTPQQQVPQVQVPQVQVPQVQVPQAETPRMQTPQAQEPQMQVPQVQVPPVQVPQVQTPQPRFQPEQSRVPQVQIPRVPTPQVQTPTMSGMGYIIVRVTTANGAIPLEDALVVVKNYNPGNDVVSVKKTDLSGLTEKIALPAPARSGSLAPSNVQAYSTYNIEINKDGYNPQSYINVPVFDGITAVQSADLVPLPENGETDRANPYNPGIFYESENPFLGQSQGNE